VHDDDRTVAPALSIGRFLVEPALNRISAADRDLRVERKVMRLLVRMASQPGQVVTREQLLDDIWGYHVGDDALHTVVAMLRRALADPDAPPIETVPKVGYRLAVPVATVAADTPAPDASLPTPGAPPGPGPAELERRRSPWAPTALLAASLVASGAVGAWWTATWTESAAPKPARLLPLTSERGLEVQPALSPGRGDRVAYASRPEGASQWDLFLRAPGEGAARLTDSTASEFRPAWSPDASRLAFVRLADRTCTLWTISIASREERRVADCPGDDVGDLGWAGLGWAGPEALVVSARATAHAPLTLHRVDIAGGRAVRLTSPAASTVGDALGRVSPDGRRLAVVHSPAIGVQDLSVATADGAERRRRTFDAVKIHGVDWRPDSRALVFSSNRIGAFALWRVDADGGTPGQLAATGDDLDAPSVSAGGARVAFERCLTETSVRRVTLDDEAAAPLLSFTRWGWHLAVAERTGELAFVSDRSGAPEVWTAAADGGTPVQRTTLAGPYLTRPRWSPDAGRIAVGANGRLSVLDLTSGVLRPLAPDDGSEDRQPAWSPDGRALYVASNRSGTWQIWRHDAGGGAMRQITTRGGVHRRCRPTARRSSTAGLPRAVSGGQRWPPTADSGPRRRPCCTWRRSVTTTGP
jgi:Tol biopolymer transport system component/DNA-binding winged helix-turn-helix (wHTH) protein